LGKLYARNTSIEQHQQIAVKYFQRAVATGNPIGQTGLGMAYYYGAGVDQNYEEALKRFQQAADQSYGEAQLMLGIMHANGLGVRRNTELAFTLFQAAARSGHILGYSNLGWMHATGTGVLPSCPIACDFYKNVAERGSWSRLFNEALRLYRRGKIQEAFRIYLYLAELGYEIAQSNAAYILDRMPDQLLRMYRNRQKSYGKALLYWNRAANQGYQYAHIKLGDYYY
jgi:SEL1 protein